MVVPFFGWISVVIVCLVALRKGVQESAWVLGCVLITALLENMLFTSFPFALAGVILVYVLPWGLALLLRVSAKWQYVLEMQGGIAFLLIAIAHLLVPDLQKNYADHMAALYHALPLSAGSGAPEQHMISLYMLTLAKYLSGIQAIFYMIGASGSLLFARWLQSILYHPQGLSKELHPIHLSYWFSGLTLACVVGVILGLSTALDSLPVFILLYTLVGISLVHHFSKEKKHGRAYLIAFYVFFFVFLPFSIIPLIGISVIDLCASLRQNIQKSVLKKR